MRIKISGIYKIINKINNKYYVGSSNDVWRRKRGHWNDLRGSRHDNIHLQRAWDIYGEENFKFIIVESGILEGDLLPIEQTFLDIAKNERDKCYNLRFIAIRNGNIKCAEKISGENHYQYDWTIYNFYRDDEEFFGTRMEFMKTCSINDSKAGRLVRGEIESAKGWKCRDVEYKPPPPKRTRLCKATSFDGDIVYFIVLRYFCQDYNLSENSCYRAFQTKKPYKGWKFEYIENVINNEKLSIIFRQLQDQALIRRRKSYNSPKSERYLRKKQTTKQWAERVGYKPPDRIKFTDINDRLFDYVRNFILRKTKKSLYSTILDLLNCSIDEFRIYLENLWQEGMSWENYGDNWCLTNDISPDSYNLEEECQQKVYFHYTNFRPSRYGWDSKLYNQLS